MLLRLLVIAVALVLAAGWLGFRVPSTPFPTVSAAAPESLPLPSGLPEPVQRYVATIFGDSMPKIASSQVIGRAAVTINGITLPTRFRFYHDIRRGHYHDIQATWFTLPVLFINERFLDGHAILDIPFAGRTENDPKTDAGSNQGFWGELIAWVPSMVFSDPRVRWEAIDATSARMIVPNAGSDEENFIVRFDPATGLMTELESLRYQGPESTARLPWSNKILEWRTIGGVQIAVKSSTHWNHGAPWVVWEIEQVVPNVDVTERLNRFGA